MEVHVAEPMHNLNRATNAVLFMKPSGNDRSGWRKNLSKSLEQLVSKDIEMANKHMEKMFNIITH